MSQGEDEKGCVEGKRERGCVAWACRADAASRCGLRGDGCCYGCGYDYDDACHMVAIMGRDAGAGVRLDIAMGAGVKPSIGVGVAIGEG